MSNRLVAAVIGCGNISTFHFSGLEKAGVQIKWVCDLNEESARPWAEKYNATFTSDYREIIADMEVNLINVTSIARTHKTMCIEAIKAGKAVICEKTLAENADDAFEIVQKAEEAGTIFYTSYMKRFLPAVEKAKEIMPKLGRILTTHIRSHQPWGDGHWAASIAEEAGEKPATPSGCVASYGGGILTCGGSHTLDLTMHLVGRPHRVYASVHTPENKDYDVRASALMETKDNGVVFFEALNHPHTHIGFLRDGWDERVEIIGTEGRLEIRTPNWNEVDSKASLLHYYDNRTANSQEYRFDAESPFDRAIAFFCKNIAKGEQGKQSCWTGYEVDELISHIKKSAASGQAEEILWKA
jgi:predicted dehydrogenase